MASLVSPPDAPRTPSGYPLTVTDPMLQAFLDEDLGKPWMDVTTDPVFDMRTQGSARLVARETLVVSGLDEALRVLQLAGAGGTRATRDGHLAKAGETLATVTGPTRALLRGERTALNILGRMSGIATLTHVVQGRVSAVNPRCRVAATRKTTPGFRVFEKRAVVHGGGDPHRFGLFDQVLVKDNHRAAFGDLDELVRRLRASNPGLMVEVEVETEKDAVTAAEAGADILLVDNQTPEDVGRFGAAAKRARPQILIEASGGITPDNAGLYAPHADRVSLGALTQRARAMDVALDWHAPSP